MDLLSVREVAELRGCTPQAIRNMLNTGKLQMVETRNEKNRPLYLVPVSALEPNLQQRYYDRMRKAMPVPVQAKPSAAPLDHYTAAERDEIAFWIGLLERWQTLRNAPGAKSKAETDNKFVLLCQLEYPTRDISARTIYRKYAAYQDNDLDGLVDNRGKTRKGKSSMDDQLWQAFLTFYLDESQHPISRCVDYTRMWAQEHNPALVAEMPSESTFRRRVLNEVSEPVRVMGREGAKAYYDRCSLYVRRTYEDMASNDWWVADNHTFDIQTAGADGKVHRLHLTAFFDARSGIFTGCHVTDNPCSQATLIALRKGIKKYGIPRNIYVDNGSEFLVFDIGGRGHRTRKSQEGKFLPPPVFKRLGISMTNAIVRNARAKVIERRFRDVKDHLSRLFDTYTGGNVVEKPDRLKKVLKDGMVPTDNQLIEVVEQVMEYYFNEQTYNGEVRADKGKTRTEVFWQHLTSQRLAAEDELNLMLMRSSRPQKVGRRGVSITVSGYRIDYYNQDLRTLMGREVYLRYDPENLDTVRVYDLQDRYLMDVPRDNLLVMPYGASKDAVSEAMKEIRKAERVTKEAVKYAKLPIHARTSALELVMLQAGAAKEARILPEKNIKSVELHRAQEQPLLPVAVGEVNINKMAANAAKRKQQRED